MVSSLCDNFSLSFDYLTVLSFIKCSFCSLKPIQYPQSCLVYYLPTLLLIKKEKRNRKAIFFYCSCSWYFYLALLKFTIFEPFRIILINAHSFLIVFSSFFILLRLKFFRKYINLEFIPFSPYISPKQLFTLQLPY